MNKIALFGKPYSGKSTLALELEKRGYVYVNFSRHLKVLAATALSTVFNSYSPDLIEANKERYRPFLREFAQVIGFDSDPSFIENAIFMNHATLAKKVVFDNPRTLQQAQALNSLGFALVGLTISPTAALSRSGMTHDAYLELIQHPTENLRDVFEIADEVVSSDFYKTSDLAAHLEKWGN